MDSPFTKQPTKRHQVWTRDPEGSNQWGHHGTTNTTREGAEAEERMFKETTHWETEIRITEGA